jgi:hypothetical protein
MGGSAMNPELLPDDDLRRRELGLRVAIRQRALLQDVAVELGPHERRIRPKRVTAVGDRGQQLERDPHTARRDTPTS